MPRSILAAVLTLLALALPARADDPHHAADEARLRAGQALLATSRAVQHGDLDAMRARGTIRVLTDWTRTDFFIENGQPRGLSYELMNSFGEWLNAREGRDDHRAPKLRLLFVPTALADIVPALAAGRGDIAAAGITATEARARSVTFTRPYLTDVAEVVVAHRGAPALAGIEDLAGKPLLVQAGSSEEESARALSARLVGAGRAAIDIRPAPPGMTLEDALELANSGAVPYVVADSHVAKLWARVLHEIDVRTDLALSSGRQIAAAVRHDSPQLKEALDAFLAEHGERHRGGSGDLIARYFGGTQFVRNPHAAPVLRNARELAPHFRRHSDQVGMAWLLMLAQGFQESGLNPEARNPSGAVGVMQVLPTTGRELGFPDVHPPEPNIAAGVRYMDRLRRTYFNDPAISPENQVFFALAGYNAGPNRIARLRQKAPEQGLDPNVWFNNVERIVLQTVGQETVRYVGNIYRYFVMFSAAAELQQ
jgi:membrane-bound lytic murein transglycosylase MltF